MDKVIEKIPSWLLAFSVFGLFVLIIVSIYLEKPFTIAGIEFGAIEKTIAADELDPFKKLIDNNTKKIQLLESQPTSAIQASLPIGTVIASVLSPANFSHYYGQDWIIADGREINTRTKYFEMTGKSTVPDFRGRFLRGMNVGSTVDPQSNRQVGSTQEDSIINHTHTIASVTSKSHGPNNQHPHGYQNGGYGLPVSSTGNVVGTVSTSETRPKNTSVYFYIKINGKS